MAACARRRRPRPFRAREGAAWGCSRRRTRSPPPGTPWPSRLPGCPRRPRGQSVSSAMTSHASSHAGSPRQRVAIAPRFPCGGRRTHQDRAAGTRVGSHPYAGSSPGVEAITLVTLAPTGSQGRAWCDECDLMPLARRCCRPLLPPSAGLGYLRNRHRAARRAGRLSVLRPQIPRDAPAGARLAGRRSAASGARSPRDLHPHPTSNNTRRHNPETVWGATSESGL